MLTLMKNAETPVAAMDDAALLRAVAERSDGNALVALFERHLNALYRLALRLSGNPTDAEETVQDGLVDAWSAAHSYGGTGSVRSWLLSVVANSQRRRARSRQRRWHHEANTPTTRVPVANPDLTESVQNALACLPEKYRVPVAMRYLDGFEFAEIAISLGIREKSARTRVARGLERMRKRMAGGEPVALLMLAAPIISVPVTLSDRMVAKGHGLSSVAIRAKSLTFAVSIAASLVVIAAASVVIMARKHHAQSEAAPAPAAVSRLILPPAVHGRGQAIPIGYRNLVINVSGDAKTNEVRIGVKTWTVHPPVSADDLSELRALSADAYDSSDKVSDPAFGNWPRPKLRIDLRIDANATFGVVAAVNDAVREGYFSRHSPAIDWRIFPLGGSLPAKSPQPTEANRLAPLPIPDCHLFAHIPSAFEHEIDMGDPWITDNPLLFANAIEMSMKDGTTYVTKQALPSFAVPAGLSKMNAPQQVEALMHVVDAMSAMLRPFESEKTTDRADLMPIAVRIASDVPWGDVIAVLDAILAYELANDRSAVPNGIRFPELRRTIVLSRATPNPK
jgi:RNA polymerase sigma-70 factor, ECF subfamily